MKRKILIPVTAILAAVLLFFGFRFYILKNNNKPNNNNYSNLNPSPSNQNYNYNTPINTTNFNPGTVPATYRFPAEFEKQQAIWIQWPSEAYNQGANPVNPTMINIVMAFEPYITVNVMVRDENEIAQIKNLLANKGYAGTKIQFQVINHLSIWTRDVGPIFVYDHNNKLNVVNFGFNNYSRDGNQLYINTESQVHRLVAEKLGLPIISTNLISEGGAIESNGKGTLMLTESVALKRNSSMTKQQIEDEYKRVLGVSKIIWLKKGLSEDDSVTSGHINEIARFADQSTILLAQVLPSDRYTNSASNESYLRLEENYNILSQSTDQDGNPFRIIRIPMPPTIYQKKKESGEIPIRSYLNYAATNGAVVMQTYWKPGLSDTLRDAENEVKDTLSKVYPGRAIIGINPESINLWGGGIHCITQHMPAE